MTKLFYRFPSNEYFVLPQLAISEHPSVYTRIMSSVKPLRAPVLNFRLVAPLEHPHDFCPWRRRSIISLGWLTNVPLKIGAENRSPPTAFSAPNLIRNRRNKSARSFDCVYARPPFGGKRKKERKKEKRKGIVALFNEG